MRQAAVTEVEKAKKKEITHRADYMHDLIEHERVVYVTIREQGESHKITSDREVSV